MDEGSSCNPLSPRCEDHAGEGPVKDSALPGHNGLWSKGAMTEKRQIKQRGVFEKRIGSGIWWIQYFDSEGQRHREKVGRKSAALMLYQKRRSDIREGKKLPVLRNTPVVKFEEIAADALEYSKSHNI